MQLRNIIFIYTTRFVNFTQCSEFDHQLSNFDGIDGQCMCCFFKKRRGMIDLCEDTISVNFSCDNQQSIDPDSFLNSEEINFVLFFGGGGLKTRKKTHDDQNFA